MDMDSDDNNLNFLPPHIITEATYEKTVFKNLCEAHPVTLVKNAANIFGISMALFATTTLVDVAGEQHIDIREQSKPDGASWVLSSMVPQRGRHTMSIAEYAKVQAAHSDDNAVEYPLQFGTNFDLDDEEKWAAQYREVEKLPKFMWPHSEENMLSETNIGRPIQGINKVQLYAKTPGCSTGGHQEHLMMQAVNLSVGSSSRWYCLPAADFERLRAQLALKGVDWLHNSWWPNAKELVEMGFALISFVQRPGDLVVLAPGYVC